MHAHLMVILLLGAQHEDTRRVEEPARTCPELRCRLRKWQVTRRRLMGAHRFEWRLVLLLRSPLVRGREHSLAAHVAPFSTSPSLCSLSLH